jgi:hypothetical protein
MLHICYTYYSLKKFKLNILDSIKKIRFVYALHMHKVQRGQKLSVLGKVLTPFNFLTLPSFSVTLPSCQPVSMR